MINPHGNALPACPWRKHAWRLVSYIVALGGVCERFECPQCKRIKFEQL
jgi:hypothetical protein